jgi:hypothetical protein
MKFANAFGLISWRVHEGGASFPPLRRQTSRGSRLPASISESAQAALRAMCWPVR